MTKSELAEWGRKEAARRAADMANVNSAESLARVQKACAERRKAIGLSRGEAARWVLVGQRLERGESLEVALR